MQKSKLLYFKILFFRFRRINFSFDKKENFFDKLIYFYYLFFNFFKTPYLVKKILKGISFFSFYNYNQLEKIQNDRLDLKNSPKIIFKIKSSNQDKSNDISKEKNDLYNYGFIKISHYFNKLDCENFVKSVEKLKAYNSQVPLQSNHKEVIVNEIFNYYSLRPDVKELKEFYKNILSNDKLKILIKSYLGEGAKLYSINTMITMPSKIKHSVTDLHRDYDDINFLGLMIYWTKTTYVDGSTYFVPESHRSEVIDQKNGLYLEGDPGDIYLMDTYALHSGNKNLKKKRIVTWMRFSKNQFNVSTFDNKEYLFFDYFNELWN